ncbi:pyrroline-5-carboxylate reductase [Brevibacillus sp. SYSU BS000544]|uniref:pyrroline-5-carboxylate reductase n=1 Tax=Brevibacillus sp. SYSU BS000544 TaxID=3416443 RepID=UPI003CE5BACA
MRTNKNNHSLQDMRIGFLGAGSIVEAILNGIIKNNLLSADRIVVTNRSNDDQLQKLTNQYMIHATRDSESLVKNCDVLILAMKPKDAQEACLSLRGLVDEHHLIVSVIAGISTTLINEWLGVNCPVIRTMPNTSSAVGLSATGIAKGNFACAHHLTLASQLFESIGSVYSVVEDELDIVTGLSGSGPAYIYYLVEAMEGAGTMAGLTPTMARQLTVQTLLGAAQMLMHTNEEPAVLRHKVTSPGGTTQAGLEVLENFEVKRAFFSAILRATERARELGAQFR